MNNKITVIGAGLAGCEAAFQIAERGIDVRLIDIKPNKYTPAHKLKTFAELVCSNSLKSIELSNSHGLLKQELLLLGSKLLKIAFANPLPAGKALSVDRIFFSEFVTSQLKKNQHIEIITEEIEKINLNEITIISAGPLITEPLLKEIQKLIGKHSLFFYDAIAPTIYSNTIDLSHSCVSIGNRYGSLNEEGDYINLMLTKEEYNIFYESLISAELHNPHDFEDNHFFQGCMPIEELAKSGFDTLRFGTMKPVGFLFPDGNRPFAVVQLRKEDAAGQIYNIVGFQTRLKYGEQERVFKLLPGLKNVEFARKGSMHRNTYISSPSVLTKQLNLKTNPNIFIAGQLSGVEGYVESIGSGLVAGINAVNLFLNLPPIILPNSTMMQCLINYITDETKIKNFQPINANFGIMIPLEKNLKVKRDRYAEYSKRSLENLKLMLPLKF